MIMENSIIIKKRKIEELKPGNIKKEQEINLKKNKIVAYKEELGIKIGEKKKHDEKIKDLNKKIDDIQAEENETLRHLNELEKAEVIQLTDEQTERYESLKQRAGSETVDLVQNLEKKKKRIEN